MNERENFLKEIEGHWHDLTLRRVYADWLDERGGHEEAEYQRGWAEAFDWITNFFNRHRSKWDDPEDVAEYGRPEDPYVAHAYYPIATPKKLAQCALEALKEYKGGKRDPDGWWSGLHIHCGANQDIQRGMRQEGREFWKRIAIMARMPISEDEAENASYSCSC